jgi:DNA-binding winged helix-turn-helix (wHTH) protein
VLIGAESSSRHEARQIALGADCVQRDPVRTDVLAEYLAHFQCAETPAPPPRPAESFRFAAATVFPLELRLAHGARTTSIAPRELELIELLHDQSGQVVTYEALYRQILGRRFTGETSNLRVLLGKVARSFSRIRLRVRSTISVIPKTGYRYDAPPGGSRVP